MIVRCKHRKNPPGDGGIVDGCGWQGEHQAVCPGCGSRILREVCPVPLSPLHKRHCWECGGLGHGASDCPNVAPDMREYYPQTRLAVGAPEHQEDDARSR